MATLFLTTGEPVAIDDADYETLSSHVWSLAGNGYAATNINYKTVYIHRMIVGAKKGQEVDHINRDKLDNRRSNLRICTPSQNKVNRPIRPNNTTGFIGVTWHTRARKYQARIMKGGKKTHLGLFESPIDAARAYNNAAMKEYGEFAQLNDLEGL